MQPIILIPARLASTRLPNKPLAQVGDAPMIVQVWRKAMAADLGEVVVACDGREIAEVIEKEGGRAVITDPNLPSGSDRIHAALVEIDPGKKHDVVVNLQGDMPTIGPAVICEVAAMLSNPSVDIATLCAPIDNERDQKDPAVVKVIFTHAPGKKHGRAIAFSREAKGNSPFYHHIGIYAYRRAVLEKFVSLPPSALEQKEKLEQLRAMEAGMRIEVAVIDKAPIGVDTKETLEEARKQYG